MCQADWRHLCTIQNPISSRHRVMSHAIAVLFGNVPRLVFTTGDLLVQTAPASEPAVGLAANGDLRV